MCDTEIRTACSGLFCSELIEWFLGLSHAARRDLLTCCGQDRTALGDCIEENGGQPEWLYQIGAPLITGGYLGGSPQATTWETGHEI